MATNIKHGGGRKQDCIWMEFERSFIPGIAGVKAKCKSCSKEMMGIVSRMKKHIVQCKDLNDQALLPSKFSLKSIKGFKILTLLPHGRKQPAAQHCCRDFLGEK